MFRSFSISLLILPVLSWENTRLGGQVLWDWEPCQWCQLRDATSGEVSHFFTFTFTDLSFKKDSIVNFLFLILIHDPGVKKTRIMLFSTLTLGQGRSNVSHFLWSRWRILGYCHQHLTPVLFFPWMLRSSILNQLLLIFNFSSKDTIINEAKPAVVSLYDYYNTDDK